MNKCLSGIRGNDLLEITFAYIYFYSQFIYAVSCSRTTKRGIKRLLVNKELENTWKEAKMF
jgi:hypothetical protein